MITRSIDPPSMYTLWSLYIQVIEEEDPSGHVREGPSPSTVTDKVSGDVDPPPQITDQISAVSHISLVFDLVRPAHSSILGTCP